MRHSPLTRAREFAPSIEFKGHELLMVPEISSKNRCLGCAASLSGNEDFDPELADLCNERDLVTNCDGKPPHIFIMATNEAITQYITEKLGA